MLQFRLSLSLFIRCIVDRHDFFEQHLNGKRRSIETRYRFNFFETGSMKKNQLIRDNLEETIESVRVAHKNFR